MPEDSLQNFRQSLTRQRQQDQSGAYQDPSASAGLPAGGDNVPGFTSANDAFGLSVGGNGFGLPNSEGNLDSGVKVVQSFEGSRLESDLLYGLKTRNFNKVEIDPARHSFRTQIWIAPYAGGILPSPHQLFQVKAYDLGLDGVSFLFPMTFAKTSVAIRLQIQKQTIDFCAEVETQILVQTVEYGYMNQVDCRFIGRLHLT